MWELAVELAAFKQNLTMHERELFAAALHMKVS